MKLLKKKNKIIIFGNGGSASIANHFLCDFNKGVKISSKKKKTTEVYFTYESNGNNYSDCKWY